MVNTRSLSMVVCISLAYLFADFGGVCAESPEITIDRSIIGISLGSTLERVKEVLSIDEREDPVVAFLSKHISPKETDKRKQINKIIRRSFYVLSSPNSKLSKGVISADFEFWEGVLYQIGLHYSKSYVEQVGRQGFLARFIGKYGEPLSEHPSSYKWSDERSRIQLEYSGDIVNIFYTDLPLSRRVHEAERTAEDFLDRNN